MKRLLLLTAILFLAGCEDSGAKLMPAAQSAFEKARISRFNSYKSAPNEIKKSQVFNEANEETVRIALENHERMDGWIAKLNTIETSQGGLDVTVKMESPLKSTYRSETTLGFGITKKDPVYNQIGELKEGDLVRFSGTLVRNPMTLKDPKPIFERSLTEEGSLEEPEYVVKISAISKAR